MDEPNLLLICISSFSAVMIILSLLALMMRLLLVLFPVKIQKEGNDTAIIAAITTAYNRKFPGTKISNIGENK
jgi:hypothetical protein